MLPRVSAALAQFIAPIATSGKQSLSQGKGFERFKPQGKQQQPEAEQGEKLAQVIQLPVAPKPEQREGASIPVGISQALLQLMNLLHEQRASLLRWIGSGIYQSASRMQKKNGRIRKGSVLDERAE